MSGKLKRFLTALGLAAAVILLLDAGCPFRHLTGIPCPGCGMTRAYLSALRLDFAGAFRMHPLWPLPVPLFLFTVFRPGPIFRNRKWENLFWGLLLALVLGVYLVRMLLFFPHTPPMDYNPRSLLGWLSRFF